MALNKISEEIIEVKLEGASEVEKQIADLSKRLNKLEKATKKADKETEKAAQGFSKLQASIATAGAAAAGFQAAMAAAGAAMSAIKAPINLAVDFETQFNQIKTLNSEIGDDLRTKLLELAKNVPQTAGDLTSAAYQAISAGIDPGQVTEFLEAASKSAVAAGGSLTESVELLTAGVNAFGKQGETASSVADKLFATVKRGVTTIPELNAVFGRAAATASSYGIGLDEVLGAIATLTKQGLPTAEAVTRVNATIKELSREGGTAAKALKKQGVQVGVLALQQKGLVGVLEEVNKATGGQADQISKLSGRAEAVGGMLALTGANMEGFRETVRGVATDVGASGEAFDVMNTGTQGAINSFNSLKEGVLRELGEQTLPALNDLLRALSGSLSGSGGAAQSFGKALGGIIKTIAFMIENVGKLGVTLTTVFAASYAQKFVREVGGMRAALAAFQSYASVQGVASGASFARGFVSSAVKSFAGPALAGAVALAATTAISAIIDGQNQSAAEQQEAQKRIANEEIALFYKKEGIKRDQVEKTLAVGQRQIAIDKARLRSSEALAAGDEDLSEGIDLLVQKLEGTVGETLKLNDLWLINRRGAEALGVAFSQTASSAGQLSSTINSNVSAAKDYDTKLTTLAQSQQQLNEQTKAAKDQLFESGYSLDVIRLKMTENIDATNKLREEEAKLADPKRRSAYDISLVSSNAKIQEGLQRLQDEYDELVKKETLALESQKNLSSERDTLEASTTRLSKEQDALTAKQEKAAEIVEYYAQNVKLSTDANKERAEAVKAEMNALIQSVGVNSSYADFLRKVLAQQLANIKAETDAENERDKAAKARRERSKKAIEQAKKLERGIDVQRLKNQEQDIQRETEIAVQKLENIRTISLARLEAQTGLTELEKLEESRRINAEADEKVQTRRLEGLAELNNKRHEVIEATEKEAIATIRNKDISNQAKDALIKAEEEKTRVKVEELDKRTKAESDALDKQAKAAKTVADVEAPAATAEAAGADRARAAEKKRFELELMREESLERRELESELRLEEQYARIEQLKLGANETLALRQKVADREKEIEKEKADEVIKIHRRQQAAAADAVSGMFGDLAMLASQLDASDSFVGKIEAAQILAKGVYHAFQGASDQADALSAFATPGQQARGLAKQAAAVAHFAQAAAAPIMAAMAVSGRAGGASGISGGGGGGGGGGAVSGPRATSERRTEERQERQAAIQFGDIILSDVPALLSKQGARALGQQIAGDVAREINRSRAIPGGFRV